jgi:2-polyprenyl-3-methyl-5-hydroxy-6-metoxy-1,4-benzoquinol methylase
MASLASPNVSILAVDTSDSMVQEYNKKARAGGFSEYRMKAVVGDLISTSDKDDIAEFRDFDLIVVCVS